MSHRFIGVHINFEPADRSVGIMGESFAAWPLYSDDKGDEWCELVDVATWEFCWESDGEQVAAPVVAPLVEAALRAFVEAFYGDQDCGDEAEDEMLEEFVSGHSRIIE